MSAIDRIVSIHQAVEENRGDRIPDWAYRDVLFMLIHYSIAAYELLERKLTDAEKEDLLDVFYRMGTRMHLKDLPSDYASWRKLQQQHLETDLLNSHYTKDLYKQYRKHLGAFRYRILVQSQKLVCPPRVLSLLGLKSFSWASPLLVVYKLARVVKLDGLVKEALLPRAYMKEIKALDKAPV